MPKIPVITAKQLLKALHKVGYIKVGQKGSHIKLKYQDMRVIVPFHKGKDLPPKTLKAIIQDAGLSIEEPKNLL